MPSHPRSVARAVATLTGSLLLAGTIAAPSGAVGVPPGPGRTDRVLGTIRPSERGAIAWPAQSGTVVYISANNVWIARADGTGARRLTQDGTAATPYFSPSEDDAGHVVAARGNGTSTVLVRMDQSGTVLQRFAPPVRSLGIGFAQVSPDGKAIAYGALFGRTDCSFTPCHTFFDHQLHYTSAVASSTLAGYRETADGATHATWVSSSRTLLETSTPQQVDLHSVSAGDESPWFTACTSDQSGCNDTNYFHYTPAETRQGDRYASAMETQPWSGGPTQDLLLLATSGVATEPTPAPPTGTGCIVAGGALPTDFPTPDQMTVYDPSWSPDGRSLVVAMRSPDTGWAVERIDVPDLADCATATGGQLLAGAREPFWGKAGLAPRSVTLRFTGRHPVVTGRPVRGRTLQLSRTPAQLRAGFSPHATGLAFRWLRDGHPIRGATSRTHMVVRADRHRRLSCRITGLRSGDHSGHVTTRAVRIK